MAWRTLATLWAQIIHVDAIATSKRRRQTLLNIGDEGGRFIDPSKTKGATIPSLRSPATKVMVFQ